MDEDLAFGLAQFQADQAAGLHDTCHHRLDRLEACDDVLTQAMQRNAMVTECTDVQTHQTEVDLRLLMLTALGTTATATVACAQLCGALHLGLPLSVDVCIVYHPSAACMAVVHALDRMLGERGLTTAVHDVVNSSDTLAAAVSPQRSRAVVVLGMQRVDDGDSAMTGAGHDAPMGGDVAATKALACSCLAFNGDAVVCGVNAPVADTRVDSEEHRSEAWLKFTASRRPELVQVIRECVKDMVAAE